MTPKIRWFCYSKVGKNCSSQYIVKPPVQCYSCLYFTNKHVLIIIYNNGKLHPLFKIMNNKHIYLLHVYLLPMQHNLLLTQIDLLFMQFKLILMQTYFNPMHIHLLPIQIDLVFVQVKLLIH